MKYVGTDYYKDARLLLELCCNCIDLYSVHVRKMLQKPQLQRVNRISKLTVACSP